MASRRLDSRLHEESMGRSLLLSAVGHALVFSVAFLGVYILEPQIIHIGSGQGGGQSGDFVTVGLTDEISGGAGMYKPSIVPQPEASPALPRKQEPPKPGEEETIFEKAVEKEVPRKSPPIRPPVQKKEEPRPPVDGVVPHEPRPGKGGPAGGGGGAGGGLGVGIGPDLGSGTGGSGGIDSWYVRRVEQRVGENWLRTRLGQLQSPVETTVGFEVTQMGRIEAVTILESSGVQSVDLAAERAVRASDPLPPLPLELRRRRVRFVAHFQYPPR